MKNSNSIMEVADIVRDFLMNEAKTLKISRGKMLRDNEVVPKFSKILEVF